MRGRIPRAGSSFTWRPSTRSASSWRSPRSIRGRRDPGAPPTLTLDEFPGRSFQGTLVRNANAIDLASRTLLVEVDVDNPSGELLPGPTSSSTASCRKQVASVAVPANTLLFRAEGLQVAVVRDGRAQLVPVTIGRDYGTDRRDRRRSPADRPGHRRRRRTRSTSGTRVRIAGAPAEGPAMRRPSRRRARARRAAGRRLHGRPRLHEAVGADDPRLQGDGWLEDRAAERSPAARPVVGALRRSRAPRAGGAGGGGQPEFEDRRGPAARGRAWSVSTGPRCFPRSRPASGPASIRESSNQPFRPPGLEHGQQRRSPLVARHVVRGRPVGPGPPHGGGGPAGGAGDRRRSRDRPAQPAGRAGDGLLRAAGRRRRRSSSSTRR